MTTPYTVQAHVYRPRLVYSPLAAAMATAGGGRAISKVDVATEMSQPKADFPRALAPAFRMHVPGDVGVL